jgi:hypothetical protein
MTAGFTATTLSSSPRSSANALTPHRTEATDAYDRDRSRRHPHLLRHCLLPFERVHLLDYPPTPAPP